MPRSAGSPVARRATKPVAAPGLTPADPNPGIDRTVAAVVIDWDGMALGRRGAGLVLRDRIEQLCTLGIHVALLGEPGGDPLDTGLGARNGKPGHLLVAEKRVSEQSDGSDTSVAMRDVLARLDDLGVGPELVLVVGDQLGGGHETLVALLDEQIRRARHLRVPSVAWDPAWTLVERGVDVRRHRVTESLFTLSSGGVAVRGSVEELREYGEPLVSAAGVYGGSQSDADLLEGPNWTLVGLTPPAEEDVRVLDLRTGVLYREESHAGDVPLRSLRFGSITEPRVMAMRLEAGTGRVHSPVGGEHDGPVWSVTTGDDGHAIGGIGVLTEERHGRDAAVHTLQRIVGVDSSRSGRPSRGRAGRRLQRASAKGFDALLAEQRAAWSRRWNTVDVRIPDDPASERALRFALFQLWGLTGMGEEAAVGARGLTGLGYSGHVFWDTDVFVLPALMTMDPAAANAVVRYRLERLDAARAHATATGRQGARFPWESARTGADVTPHEGFVGAEKVRILTGQAEEHVTADVPWSIVRNASWNRPTGHLSPRERLVLAETARYWASRLWVDGRRVAHIDDVIGPDEYHEHVDDNAYTNVMARWNLRTAARVATTAPDEQTSWSWLADALDDGYDAKSGRHEQFRGYFDLEPLVMSDIAPPPIAADVLLGHERIARTQLIKQPDVMMLHHLVPEELQAGSLAADLDWYAPRTAHGSSLSPAIMAVLHARAGQADEALRLLRLSLSIDLDDLGGTTSAGVHIGACGGAWQAVVFGFLGAQVRDGRLLLDPVLPSEWGSLEVRFCCLGREVRVAVDGESLTVESSRSLPVSTPHGQAAVARPGRAVRLTRGGQG